MAQVQSEGWSFSGAEARWLVAPIVLVLLVLATYLNSFRGGFVLDDHATLNVVAELTEQSRLGAMFTQPSLRFADGATVYRPLTMLSYALDYQLWHRNPFGYHQTNVWLHVCGVVLAYVLVVRVTRRRGLALAAACLFAVHPVTSHCVAHVTNRGPLLATVGTLGALWLFAISSRWHDVRREIMLVAAAGVGMLSLLAAESAVLLPVLAGVYLLACEPTADRRRWKWVGVLATLAVGFLLVRFVVLRGWGEPAHPPVLTLGQHLLAAVRAVSVSFSALVMPQQLQLQYPLASGSLGWRLWDYALGVGIMAVALVLLWRARRAAPALWFGLLWAVIGMVPVWIYAGWTGALAEQWLYLPAIGLLLVVCGVATRFLERMEPVQISPAAMSMGVVLVAVLLAVSTRARNTLWSDECLLLAQAVAQSPQTASLRLQYARSLLAAGQGDRAIAQYRQVVFQGPDTAALHTEFAQALEQWNRRDEALDHYRRAVWAEPGSAAVQFNLAAAMEQRGEYVMAIAHYRLAVGCPGAAPDAFRKLAWLLAVAPQPELRNGSQAVELAQRALQLLGERDARCLDVLAAALAEAGNFDQAGRVAQEAVQLAAIRGDNDLAATIRTRLKLYLEKKPYRLGR
jgi:tetratricopeptide (TPR) repeat protein